MDNEVLIELVQNYPELYDLSHPRYNDNSHKDIIWATIGQTMSLPGLACKHRWVNMRDQFRKVLKKRNSVSGQAAKRLRKYKYEEQMSFLKTYFNERETITNNVVQPPDIEDAEEDDADYENDRHEEAEDPLNTEEIPEILIIDNEIQNTLPSTTHQQHSRHHTPIPPVKKRRLLQKTTPTVSSMLMKYLLEKNQSQTNSVDTFLSGIGATLKSFPPYYLHLAKGKIFAAVQELEMQLLTEKKNDEKQNH